MSWVETQRVCLTFSWDETEFYSKRSCVYKLKMISCNSTLCLFPWIFISAKSQANTLSFNSTQTQTIVNNQVFTHYTPKWPVVSVEAKVVAFKCQWLKQAKTIDCKLKIKCLKGVGLCSSHTELNFSSMNLIITWICYLQECAMGAHSASTRTTGNV